MTSGPSITALFLDLGGVLLTNGWDRNSRRTAAARFGLDFEEMDERHHLTFDTYEEGKLSLDEYLQRVVFCQERAFSAEEFKAFMFEQSQPYQEMLGLIHQLKEDYHLKVVAVNNEGRELSIHRIRRFHLSNLVDFFVSSCFVHYRKPDADIYRLALDVAQVQPEQVLYIEDRAMFVEVAQGLGIRGIQHKSYESTRAALESYGLVVEEQLPTPAGAKALARRGENRVQGKAEIGMVGLGVMGRSLALNMAEHGIEVVGYDTDPAKVQALQQEAGAHAVSGASSLKEFVGLLSVPRAVMLLVPAGAPVDSVIRDLLPHLEPGDLIIDGGNSHFSDTDLRARTLAAKGIDYLGVGISGGESGARHGPSMMPGGPKEAYERVRPIFEAVAARVDEEPCVAYMGPGSAGHYVKMVHNGLEYGLMELIAETYALMKLGLGLNDDELHAVYRRWNETELNSYLLEITSHIFLKTDEVTGKRLIDVILDEARQKGTGMWMSQDAMELQVPVPTVDIAVAMRNLSTLADERQAASKTLAGPTAPWRADREDTIERLRNALYASTIVTYAQGFAQLQAASQSRGYGLDLESVARIWRGGCIIRAALLKGIAAAFHTQSRLTNLLVDATMGKEVTARRCDLSNIVCAAADLGIPSPGLMVSLSYFDGYRAAWLPANLIQAQRDYFGAHSYERVDAKGTFHANWE